MGFGALSVRGNHDHGALVAFNTLREGGQVKEIWKWAQDLTLEQARYIAAMPFVMSVPTYRIIAVHAGLVASVTMKRQRWQDLCSMYNVVTRDNPRSRRVGTSNRTRGESWQGLWKGTCPPCHFLKWFAKVVLYAAHVCHALDMSAFPDLICFFSAGPLHVLYGHAAKTTVQFRPFTTCIDTGCVYGNLLSAAIFPRSSKLKPRSSVRNWSNLQGKLVSVKAHKAYEEW